MSQKGGLLMKMNHKTATFLMMTISFAWGTSYLLMKIGLSEIAPFNLIALRFGIAFIAMVVIFWKKISEINFQTIKWGIILGSLLFFIFSFLVIGVKYTPSSTADFLASTTIIFVPLIEILFGKQKLNTKIYVSIVMTLVGLFLLTTQKSGFVLSLGAVLCILTAVFYATYIIIVDRLSSEKASGPDMFIVSIFQLGVASLLGLLFSYMLETPSLPTNPTQWSAVIALGLFCSGYGFVVQPIVQKYLSAEKIGLIFSLEPFFAALLGFIFLN